MATLKGRHKVGLVLFGLVIGVGSLELGARVYAGLSHQDRVLSYDERFGWTAVPNARKRYTAEEQSYLIEINSKGLRDREYPYEKPDGIDRILVLGDSFVFGSGGVDHSRLFTEILESSTPGLEVLNAGMPGYSPDQGLQFFQSEGYRYVPDLVVLGLFVNDFVETFLRFNTSIGRPKGYVTFEGDVLTFHPPSVSWFYRASETSYLLGWLGNRLSRRSPAAEPAGGEPEEGVRRRAFSRLLVQMRDACAAKGAEFAVVFFPFKSQEGRHQIQEVLADLAASERIPVLDLHGRLRPNGEAESSFFERDIHMNERGHALTARLLLEFLVEKTAVGSRLRGIRK